MYTPHQYLHHSDCWSYQQHIQHPYPISRSLILYHLYLFHKMATHTLNSISPSSVHLITFPPHYSKLCISLATQISGIVLHLVIKVDPVLGTSSKPIPLDISTLPLSFSHSTNPYIQKERVISDGFMVVPTIAYFCPHGCSFIYWCGTSSLTLREGMPSQKFPKYRHWLTLPQILA